MMRVICGKAGSGKTTRLAELIGQAEDYVVLAPTNAAVENIYNVSRQVLKVELKRDNFKTIYSFFRIDYEHNTLAGALYYPKTIFIDEFGLMNKLLFKKCVANARFNKVENIIICGDVLQLNPIYESKQFISFEKLSMLNKLYQSILKRMNQTSLPTMLYPSVIEHLHLNVFGSKIVRTAQLELMNTNRRANDEVKTILNNVYDGNIDYKYNFIEFYDLPNKIVKDGFVFIASRYRILQHIYDLVYERELKILDPVIIDQLTSLKFGYKKLYLTPGMKVVTCETVKSLYINGEELVFTGNVEAQGLKCFREGTNEIIYIRKATDKFGNEYYPVTPSWLLSVHKSQGRTIERVIVCIDDMFEVSMLYTAITRTKNELLFYSKVSRNERATKLIEAARIPEFRQLNLMSRFMYSKSVKDDVDKSLSADS